MIPKILTLISLSVFAVAGCSTDDTEAEAISQAEVETPLRAYAPPRIESLAKDNHTDLIVRFVSIDIRTKSAGKPPFTAQDIQSVVPDTDFPTFADADFFEKIATKYSQAKFIYTPVLELPALTSFDAKNTPVSGHWLSTSHAPDSVLPITFAGSLGCRRKGEKFVEVKVDLRNSQNPSRYFSHEEASPYETGFINTTLLMRSGMKVSCGGRSDLNPKTGEITIERRYIEVIDAASPPKHAAL